MSDLTAEIRQAVLQAVTKQIAQIDAQRFNELPAPAAGALGDRFAPLASGYDGAFATGYNGSLTVTPFQWGVSLWGPTLSGDTWTAS